MYLLVFCTILGINKCYMILQGMTTNWMETFKGLLVAYVFFVLPIILFFFPRYDKNQNHPVLQNLMNNSKINSEKVAVLVFFVILLTAGVLGVLLAHIAQGPKVTRAVGAFTLWIIISILGFMDYILVKTMPDNLTNKLMFLSHFIITTTIICFLWFKYVWPSSCCQVICYSSHLYIPHNMICQYLLRLFLI
jgi:hypothetical protein